MGKFLLLLLLATGAATSGLFFTSTRTDLGSADRVLGQRGRREVARQVAYSGMAEVESRLIPEMAADGIYRGPAEIEGRFDGGAYRATITPDGLSGYTVRSEGRMGGVTRTVLRTYRRPGPEPPVPDFIDPAYFIHNNLLTSYRFRITAEDPTRNVRIHTNNNMYIAGADAIVTGYASYSRNFELARGVTASQVLRPNVPTGDPLHARAPAIPFPAPNAAGYRSIATRYTAGDLYLSGSVQLGTRERPVVWYVGNDVRTSGDVTFSGYGIFIMANGAQFSHNTRGGGGPGGESTVMFYSNNSVLTTGQPVSITGTFYVGNTLQITQNTTITGSVALYNSMQASANFEIIHRPASAALTRVLWPPGTGESDPEGGGGSLPVELVASREW